MKRWPWLRIVAAGAGPLAALISAVFPPAAPFALPIGAFLSGIAVKTPGHEPVEVTK